MDDATAHIDNPFDLPITLVAREDVLVESEGVNELLRFASLAKTLSDLSTWEKAGKIAPYWGEIKGAIHSIVLTPDFHKGSGIPVGTVVDASGFVVPGAVGNDVCCGMRLLTTDVDRRELMPHIEAFKKCLRGIFFQGKRDIPMSPRQREAMLRDGLVGLFNTSDDNNSSGLWNYYDKRAQMDDLSRVHFGGGLDTKGTFAFDAYIQASGRSDGRDIQIGSVGGGNHFVEVQTVDELIDGQTAHAFGLSKNAVTIMAHSGSVGLGHMVGGYFNERAYDLYPKGVPHPEHGFYIFPTTGPHAKESLVYLDAMRNAANFAFANRLFLGLMVVRALSEVLGRKVSSKLVYDAPHNLIWDMGDHRFLHRKGATPAPGPNGQPGPFSYTGHPVIIPGSMGDASYVLAGEGCDHLLSSACHGAGRSLTRGKSTHVDDGHYRSVMEKLHVVTPLDPNAPDVRRRRDILAKYHARMKEEAPYAYKPITPVVKSVEDAGIARRVARLWPLVTVKG
ncbi:MAG: RtcB family protein [Polyangiaceae bacterium]|nr:RtcB family protein [Polyangiaceae bacterium]